MDRVNGFVQVWHTSTCSAGDSNGVIEGHVTTSSDVTFTLDFPIPRESYVSTPLTTFNSSVRTRDIGKVFESNFQPIHTYTQLPINPETTEMSRSVTNCRSRTRTKIAKACEEYSDISTFHGMRFVCAKKLHYIRRTTWLLIVLSCLSALSLHVHKQVMYYFSNPKTVSVEEIHVGVVEFPSLTICNENSYKITEAVDSGLYDIVNKMMTGNLTESLLQKSGLGSKRLDEIMYILGNNITTMFLRCKWGEEKCTVNNFTTILTDQGLCFTLNGPDSTRDLLVHTPGLSKGLQLALNVEEYERMAGPHVASGVRILFHKKRQYPMVGQLGQAVAAGSHTFVALSLKKERRLGHPYDECENRELTYISNLTYDYTRHACHMDCFIQHVIGKCGCKDYYMPGDVAVCTLSDYFSCLQPAKDEYNSRKEQVCQCAVPCYAEIVIPSYSYAALSRSAIDKINKEDFQKILPRYRKALDAYEYLSEENQYKKNIYHAFSDILRKVRRQSQNIFLVMLPRVRTKIKKLQDFMSEMYQTKSDCILAQTYMVKKNFVEAKNEMDDTTLGELADDLHLFSRAVENRILAIGKTGDKNMRDVLYVLLEEELLQRIWLANLSLENITQLVEAYKTGMPILNYSLPTDKALSVSYENCNIIPKELLRDALTHSEDGTNIGLSAQTHIVNISRLLEKLLKISQDVCKAENITENQKTDVHEIIDEFKNSCMMYFKARENFYTEIVEWPSRELQNASESVLHAEEKCHIHFEDILTRIDKLTQIAPEMVNSSLSFFAEIDSSLQSYIKQWNFSKFEIADLFLNNDSSVAIRNFETLRVSVKTSVENIGSLWPRIDSCMFEMIQEILKEEPGRKFYESKTKEVLNDGTETHLSHENSTLPIQQEFLYMSSLQANLLDLQQSINLISEDLKKFSDSTVMDSSFYSKNFIFLDVFFTDISYTLTEHQVAYDVFKLLSDIGGSMGLLVGASAISLFEFLDLFCVIATHIFLGSRRLGERLGNKNTANSADSPNSQR